jgi:hypothetical protein
LSWSRLSRSNLNRAIGSPAQEVLWHIFAAGQKYSDPGVMTSAAKQIDHFLQGRIHKGGPRRCEHAFDVSEQPESGAINFQGQVLQG